MSNSRRNLLKKTGIASMAILSGSGVQHNERVMTRAQAGGSGPLVISTWKNGIQANEAAMKKIMEGCRALDAVDAGVRVVEADPEDMSVGFGGRPDREGNVTLDACIMDENRLIDSKSVL